MSTLPQDAIDKLPFSAEPMFQWNKDTDIRAFVTALFSSSLYSDNDPGNFPTEEKKMRECARLFTKNLMEYPQPSTYLDFYQDARFGQVAKYAIAFRICLSSLLADGAFYSLAHILESGDDMESSLLLASNFYYKQATQMLRNILEEIFLPIHFCDTVQDFDAWKRNNYRTPKLRGNDGLIKRLLRKNIIHVVFVAVPGVPAHNNLAERSVRPLVIARKISGGTRSPQGSRTRMGLASLFQTWSAQQLNPFLQCLTLLTTQFSLG